MIEITYNTDLLSDHEHTIPYKEYLLFIKNDPFFNSILDKICDYIEYEYHKPVYNKEILRRILSYYLVPQNYNNLSYGTLNKDFTLVCKPHIISILYGYVDKGILSYIRSNNNSYFVFNKNIEKIIQREYSLHLLEV